MRRPVSPAVAIVALLALGLAAGGVEGFRPRAEGAPKSAAAAPGRGGGAAPLRVVASLPDLAALTGAVGGDLVEVKSLARGTQNPHDVDLRPSLMLDLRRADLLVRNGAGGDPWVEPLIVGSHNRRIVPGADGYVDASRGIAVLGPPGPVDRARGDVHPEGNPHYTLDPANAATITATIAEGLARVAPQHAARFEQNRRDFLARLEPALERWRQALAPFRGARVVTYHETFDYFLRRFGLEVAGTIEDRPGIPPSPAHLASLIQTIKAQRVKVILAETFADQRTADFVARETGARAVLVPAAVGGVRGVETYLDLMEHLVRSLAGALG